MGENSARSMRGAGMEDVIFAGTATRPPRDFAEVTILAEREGEETEIVRRIERGAGSAYRIDGRDVRAKDVALLFADAATGAHLWADRFDGTLEDVFDLQDQVTASVVGAISPKLEQAEIERAKRKPTENLDAYDYLLRALAHYHALTRVSLEEALRLLYLAIEIDPALTTMVVTKDKLPQSSSAYAQGGIAGVMDPADRFESHIEDTLRAGGGLCDQQIVEMVVHEAPQRIQELIRWGADFDQVAEIGRAHV